MPDFPILICRDNRKGPARLAQPTLINVAGDGNRATRIRLLENADDLRLGELRLAHGKLLARGDYRARRFSFWPAYFSGELTGGLLFLMPYLRHGDSSPETSNDFRSGLLGWPISLDRSKMTNELLVRNTATSVCIWFQSYLDRIR